MKRGKSRFIFAMALSRCQVAFIDSDGVEHSIEVDAESLYEAVALAIAEFRPGEISIDAPGPMTEFRVTVLRKPIEHKIRLKQVMRWAGPTTKEGPGGVVRRENVRRLPSV